MKKNPKDESIQRMRNALEQAKTNLKIASENDDKEEVSYWSKQVRLQEAILKRVLGSGLKKYKKQ